VELITSLHAFADYTRAWQEADEAPAGAVAIHRRLHGDVTHARRQLESALDALVEAEGLLAG